MPRSLLEKFSSRAYAPAPESWEMQAKFHFCRTIYASTLILNQAKRETEEVLWGSLGGFSGVHVSPKGL